MYNSNRMENLVTQLVKILHNPLNNPLSQEIIVVQSKGMERYLSLEIARHMGICSNITFPFPNAFIQHIYSIMIPDILMDQNHDHHFEIESMTWKIMQILPSMLNLPEFETLNHYLNQGSNTHLKQYQLSKTIANLFDQYLVFRPTMITKWDQGEDQSWQAILWRYISKSGNFKHSVALQTIVMQRFQMHHPNVNSLPERFCIFGISSLPPFHLHLLTALAQFCECHFYLLNPCIEEWSYISSEREISNILDRFQDYCPDELHLDTGNTLLASFGTLGRDFFNIIYQLTSGHTIDYHDFSIPESLSMLSTIQSDILQLKNPCQSDKNNLSIDERLPIIIDQTDKSIQIHSCHTTLREIEVLYDHLLKFFQDDPTLLPRDIVVMTPDIEMYAPYIQAVFDAASDDNLHIPYTIADRSIIHQSRIIDSFLYILELPGNRYGVNHILKILDCEAVIRKFSLTQADKERVITWIEQTNICWGIDATNRGEFGMPEYHENTWISGLERLLLGYAMPGEDVYLFNDILPYDHIEGNEAQSLGYFIHFVHTLFSIVKTLEKPHPLSKWPKILSNLITTFFNPIDIEEREVKYLRDCLLNIDQAISLTINAHESNNTQQESFYPIDIFRYAIKRKLEQTTPGYGFLSGSVTFCAMLPMRSIPFRIICLIGMNDADYPRPMKKIGFDLMAQNPKIGDRSRRNDDRYIFLEAIISARQCLYISYIGQSMKENSEMPPSVMVSLLKDYVESGFKVVTPHNNELTSPAILTKHRLQGFHPEYFLSTSSLFSFSEENYRCAQILAKRWQHGSNSEETFTILPFIKQPIQIQEITQIDLDQLLAFYKHPTKYFVRNQLGISFEKDPTLLEDIEPLKLDGLSHYWLCDQIMTSKMNHKDLSCLYHLIKAKGELPHGQMGDFTFQQANEDVRSFMTDLKKYLKTPLQKPKKINIKIGPYRLKGKLENCRQEMIIHLRYADVKAEDRLVLWIYHLVFNCMQSKAEKKSSIVAGKDGIWEINPIEDCYEQLELLIQYFIEGQSMPLHFFPKSSYKFMQCLFNRKNVRNCILSALTQWIGNSYNKGESKDPYYELCYRHMDPFDQQFMTLSQAIFNPLLLNSIHHNI